MTDRPQSLAEKLSLVKDSQPPEEEIDNDFPDDGVYRAFVVARQRTRPAEMLNLKLKDHRQHSFEYSHLYHILFLPSEGKMTLEFSDHDVEVTGLRLDDGFRQLVAHRVLQIAEADTPTAKLALHEGKEAVVTEIIIGRRGERR